MPKGQGKLDERIIIEELLKKPKKPHWMIAKMAGSRAKEKDKLTATLSTKVASSVNIQLALERDREKQRRRAMERVKKAEEKIDYEAMAKNQGVLGNFIMQNEKLLHESVKTSSEVDRDNKKINPFINTDNLTIEEIQIKKDKLKEEIDRLEKIVYGNAVEGEIVEDNE